jgi:RNA polymerase sigma-70 factor (ECF subfamily)
MKESPEKVLIEKATRFEQAALGEIFDRYHAGIFRYALRLLGEPELARECMAETFSKFLSALRRGIGPADHLQAYLYRIAHNWITDFYRKNSPAIVPLDPNLEDDPDGRPSIHFSQRQEQERVRAALAGLTPDQRQVIVLKYYENWENAEIAAALNKPVGAVKALLHRAIVALRQSLGEEMESSHETG